MGNEKKSQQKEDALQNDVQNPERRSALKKLGAIGIAGAAAPTMITLLRATQAAAQQRQSGPVV